LSGEAVPELSFPTQAPPGFGRGVSEILSELAGDLAVKKLK